MQVAANEQALLSAAAAVRDRIAKTKADQAAKTRAVQAEPAGRVSAIKKGPWPRASDAAQRGAPMPRDGAEASVGAPAALEGPPLKTMRPDACLAPAPIGAIGAAETAKPTAACVGSGASASPCPPAPTAASAAPSNFKRKLSPWTRNFLDGAAQRQQRAKVHAQEPTAQPPLDDVFIEAFRPPL
ncbi:hypothetical protein M885DRAFT_621742 [Pelagophyceae sp. CCMP2097]|nr:hypothetical protein M885DRAFT_621742 [Pelagophyceae sp. CCMP2097]